jgi:hypothetical protein
MEIPLSPPGRSEAQSAKPTKPNKSHQVTMQIRANPNPPVFLCAPCVKGFVVQEKEERQ